MKKSEIEVGKVYTAKVSGRIVPVEVLAERTGSSHYYGGANSGAAGFTRSTTKFTVRNLVTGREIVVSAARLRSAVEEVQQ
jgi:hypothetical protein